EGTDFRRVCARACVDAILAAFEDIADTKLHGIIQNPVDSIAVAIGGNARAVIPGTVGISIEVVAGLGRRIDAGTIQSPRSIFAGNAGHGLLGAADGLRRSQQDHDSYNRTRYLTHAYLLSLCLRRRANWKGSRLC